MPKRGSIASCACAPCRKRKTRCDGARPTCRACEQRRAECRYDVEEGITRTAALKGRLEQLELDYGSLVDLHSQLKHGQPDEVAALVNRIRAEDFPEVRAPLEQGSITADGLPDEMDSTEDGASDAKWDSMRTPLSGFGDIQQNPFTPIPFYGSMGDDIPIDPALSGLDPQLQQMGQSGSSSFAQQAMMQGSFNQGPGLQMYGTSIASESTPSARQLFQNHVRGMLRTNLPIVRHGMALQSRSMPESCSAYSDAQIERLIREVEVQADHEIPKSRLCELSSIAAVAAQYVRGAIQPGLIDFFYDAAKHFFEDCMQSPLPHLVPLKVCAMLALANILSRSFLAFVYIDLGLSLAQSLDDQAVSASQTTNRPDFVEARRVRGTLLSLRGYAHKHAGMSFQAGPGLVDGVDPEEEDQDPIPTDSKQMDGWMS